MTNVTLPEFRNRIQSGLKERKTERNKAKARLFGQMNITLDLRYWKARKNHKKRRAI